MGTHGQAGKGCDHTSATVTRLKSHWGHRESAVGSWSHTCPADQGCSHQQAGHSGHPTEPHRLHDLPVVVLDLGRVTCAHRAVFSMSSSLP